MKLPFVLRKHLNAADDVAAFWREAHMGSCDDRRALWRENRELKAALEALKPKREANGRFKGKIK